MLLAWHFAEIPEPGETNSFRIGHPGADLNKQWSHRGIWCVCVCIVKMRWSSPTAAAAGTLHVESENALNGQNSGGPNPMLWVAIERHPEKAPQAPQRRR